MRRPISMEIEVVNSETDHIIIRTSEPARIEVSRLADERGSLIVHAYRGWGTDPDQEPDAVYDGSIT